MPRPPSRRRAAVSFEQAQTGDIASRDAAGGSIYHHGADADAVVAEALGIVKDAFLDDQKREIRQAQVDAQLADLGSAITALRALALVDLILAIVSIGLCVAILIVLR